MDQGTPEWFAARCGKATASKVADIIARTKTGYGASRANYEAQLIAERLTNTVAESFTNAAMQWGTEKEPEARNAYSFLRDVDVELAGFIDHPTVEMSGASPDGLIGSDGLIEIKCPGTATHIDTLLGQSVPGKYITQIQWQLACTGRAWCDFVSYDPRLPESMSLWVKRIERDDVMIKSLENEVSVFLQGVAEAVEQLRALYEPSREGQRLVGLLRAG